MFFAYVLKSVHHHYLYKGHCENLEKRLKEHNSGMTRSIKHYIPFELLYFEEFQTKEEAIKKWSITSSYYRPFPGGAASPAEFLFPRIGSGM